MILSLQQAIYKDTRLYECKRKKPSKGEAKNNNLTAENAAARYFPREYLISDIYNLFWCDLFNVLSNRFSY